MTGHYQRERVSGHGVPDRSRKPLRAGQTCEFPVGCHLSFRDPHRRLIHVFQKLRGGHEGNARWMIKVFAQIDLVKNFDDLRVSCRADEIASSLRERIDRGLLRCFLIAGEAAGHQPSFLVSHGSIPHVITLCRAQNQRSRLPNSSVIPTRVNKVEASGSP